MILFNIPSAYGCLKEKLNQALKTVIDPELHVNIVDLGLVYTVTVAQDEMVIRTEMTLSSRFCPMGESILSAVKNCIGRNFDAYRAEVLLVWDPVWNYDFISPAGIELLRGGYKNFGAEA